MSCGSQDFTTYVYMNLSFCHFVYILALSPKKPRNNDTTRALNVCRTQIFISNDHSPFEGTRFPWRKAVFIQRKDKMSLKHLVP